MTYLMDKLKNDPAWGVSTRKKAPVYLGTYLKTNNPADLEYVTKDDLKHLPTLAEIEANGDFKKTPKAYHLHAKDNLVIGFDIEPACSDTWLKFLGNLKVHYREYSMHNGWHFLIQLNREKLSDKTLMMIASETERKHAEQTKYGPLEYEIMMNKHWLTVTQKTHGDFISLSEDADPIIYHWLNDESKNWKQLKHVKEINPESIGIHASQLAKNIHHYLFSKHIVERVRDLDPSDYQHATGGNDTSLYEYVVACTLAGSLNYRLSNLTSFEEKMLYEHVDLDQELTIADKVQATALELGNILQPRPKWNELRDGLPWLVFTAKRAWDYIQSSDEDEENSNEATNNSEKVDKKANQIQQDK